MLSGECLKVDSWLQDSRFFKFALSEHIVWKVHRLWASNRSCCRKSFKLPSGQGSESMFCCLLLGFQELEWSCFSFSVANLLRPTLCSTASVDCLCWGDKRPYSLQTCLMNSDVHGCLLAWLHSPPPPAPLRRLCLLRAGLATAPSATLTSHSQTIVAPEVPPHTGLAIPALLEGSPECAYNAQSSPPKNP